MTPADLASSVKALGKAPFFAEFASQLELHDISGDLVFAECSDLETFKALIEMLIRVAECPQPNEIQIKILYTNAKKSENASSQTASSEFVISNDLTIPPRELFARIFEIQGIPMMNKDDACLFTRISNNIITFEHLNPIP